MKWSGKGKAEKKASKKPRRHILRTILIVLAAVAVALALGIHIYASGYYHAEPEAQEALASTTDVTVTTLDSGDVFFKGNFSPELHMQWVRCENLSGTEVLDFCKKNG